MKNDTAIHLLIAIILGFMLISAGLTGRPGSILGSLIDPESMKEINAT